MAVTGSITTRFIDEKGLDLGKTLIEKDYLISVYPNLLNQFDTPMLMTWGYNNSGQLGDNTTTHRSSPVQTIAYGANWKSVIGHYVTVGIKTDGTLWTCGYGLFGALGDNTTVNKQSPVQTTSFGTNWKAAASCNSNGGGTVGAIKTDGTLWCWGKNSYGLIGDNTNVSRSSPVQTVAFGTNWMKISGGEQMAGIKSDGTLWLWGRNQWGGIGDNTLTNKSSPIQTITAGSNWKIVSCGSGGSVAAIKTDGTLWTWGRNNSGQLGDNTTINRSSPVQTVAYGTNWKQVSAGYGHTAAIKTDGTLWVWGSNGDGQTQDAGNAGTSPVTVSGSKTSNSTFTTSNTTGVSVGMGVYITTQPVVWTNVATVNANASIIFTPILPNKDDGTTWSGTISLGVGASSGAKSKSSPVQTTTYGTNWKQVDCGDSSTAAIKTDGTLWTWGRNQYGTLGDNTTTTRSSPVQTILYGQNWKQVFCGYNMTAAIKDGDF